MCIGSYPSLNRVLMNCGRYQCLFLPLVTMSIASYLTLDLVLTYLGRNLIMLLTLVNRGSDHPGCCPSASWTA